MRTKITSFKKALPMILSGTFLVLLSACGTHNNGYGDTDGIYTSESTASVEKDAEEVDKTNYYKQYFKSKKGSYDELPEEGAIFTDIEAYSTSDSIDEDGYIVTEEIEDGYGAWGTNSDNVTVNIYNTGGYGYGYGYGYWHRPYWYTGWGYYNHWYSPYWGIGYGWGYPYYGYYCSPYYGGYYNPYYYHGYGYNNSIAYNRGRRNTDYLAGRRSYGRTESAGRIDRARPGYDAARPNTTRPRYDSRPNSTRPQYESRPNPRTRPQSESIPNTRPQYETRPRTKPQYESRPAPRTRPQVNTRPKTRPRVNTRPSSGNRSSSMRSSRGSSRSSSGSRGGGGRRGGRN